MFRINVHKVQECTFILHLEGQLTGTSSLELQRVLHPILRKRPKAVSINLSRLNSIDRAGIAMLMSGLVGLSNRGTYFYLVGLSKKIKDYYFASSRDMGHPLFSETTH
jgi:anti-anti-sigma factor